MVGSQIALDAMGPLGRRQHVIARNDGPIRKPHDLGLVAERDQVPTTVAGVFERVANDPLAGGPGYDPQAFDDAGDDLVLQPGVQPFGVLADDHEIDIVVGRLHPR